MSNETMNDDKDLNCVDGVDHTRNNDQVTPAGLVVDEQMRQMMIELQRHWLTDYHNSLERALVELTEKLHHEFIADQHKMREYLHQQFKEELEQTKMEIEVKYRNDLKAESTKLMEEFKKELSAAKKKQWCWTCQNEAQYHCCWNTAYCSVACQHKHWPWHGKFCRREKGNGGSVPAAKPHAPSSSSHN